LKNIKTENQEGIKPGFLDKRRLRFLEKMFNLKE